MAAVAAILSNTLRLRSFQIVQNTKTTITSKILQSLWSIGFLPLATSPQWSQCCWALGPEGPAVVARPCCMSNQEVLLLGILWQCQQSAVQQRPCRPSQQKNLLMLYCMIFERPSSTICLSDQCPECKTYQQFLTS